MKLLRSWLLYSFTDSVWAKAHWNLSHPSLILLLPMRSFVFHSSLKSCGIKVYSTCIDVRGAFVQTLSLPIFFLFLFLINCSRANYLINFSLSPKSITYEMTIIWCWSKVVNINSVYYYLCSDIFQCWFKCSPSRLWAFHGQGLHLSQIFATMCRTEWPLRERLWNKWNFSNRQRMAHRQMKRYWRWALISCTLADQKCDNEKG